MREYITPSDIKNKIFNKFPEKTRQRYCDQANCEVEDIAKLKGVDPDKIAMPAHYKIKEFAGHYAVSQLAQDNIGMNNNDGYNGGTDVYLDLFKREEYILQRLRKSLSGVMFTGETETPLNRAIYSQRLIIGR